MLERADPFEIAVFSFFALATIGGVYNLVDAWRNMTAVLLANAGATSGRLVAIALDDLLRAAVKVGLMAAPGMGIGILLLTLTPGQVLPEAQRIIISLFLRVAYLCLAAGLLLVIASSLWLRRFLAAPDPAWSGDRGVRLEAALSENTALTKEAVSQAAAAYDAANTVNAKIASLGEGLTAERVQQRLQRELPPHGGQEAPA